MVSIGKNARVVGEQRTLLAAELTRRYEQGESIRSMADDLGRSYGWVQGLLKEAGVTFRARGGATRGVAGQERAQVAWAGRAPSGAAAVAPGTATPGQVQDAEPRQPRTVKRPVAKRSSAAPSKAPKIEATTEQPAEAETTSTPAKIEKQKTDKIEKQTTAKTKTPKDKPAEVEKSIKAEKPAKAEKSIKAEKPAKAEKSAKAEKAAKAEKGIASLDGLLGSAPAPEKSKGKGKKVKSGNKDASATVETPKGKKSKPKTGSGLFALTDSLIDDAPRKKAKKAKK